MIPSTSVVQAAAAMSFSPVPQPPDQIVVFRVGASSYGLDISIVEEILGDVDVTRVPEAPVGVLGIASVRQHTVPVFDLFWKFGVHEPQPGDDTAMVMVRGSEGTVALRVGMVEEVVTLPATAYELFRPPGDSSGLSYLRGIAHWGDELVLWIDPEHLIPAAVAGLAGAA
jgi:purine-binding chemotaxis protein CheW